MTTRCKLKTEIVQDSDGRTRAKQRISNVTDYDGRGIASLHKFQSGTCLQSNGASIEGAIEVMKLIWIPSLVKVACFTNTRMNGSGCLENKVSAFPMVGSLRKRQRSVVVSLTPHERHYGKRPPVSNTADTQRKTGTRIDASASLIVVWTLSEGDGNKPSAFSQ